MEHVYDTTCSSFRASLNSQSPSFEAHAHEVIQQFRQFLLSEGYLPPDDLPIGDWKNFPAPSAYGRANDDAGYCYLFPDLRGAVYGDFRSGIRAYWHAQGGQSLSPVELAILKHEADAKQRQAHLREERRNKEAAEKALALWKQGKPVGLDHPYLQRKRITPVESLRELSVETIRARLGYAPKADGVLLTGRSLLVPIKVSGKLSSLEFIDEQGRKSAIAGGIKSCGFWSPQALPDGKGEGLTLGVAEGVATALSLLQATGYLVVATLCAGNLKNVAASLRKRYPAATIIVFADHGNGQRQAEEAAQAVNGVYAVPHLQPSCSLTTKEYCEGVAWEAKGLKGLPNWARCLLPGQIEWPERGAKGFEAAKGYEGIYEGVEPLLPGHFERVEGVEAKIYMCTGKGCDYNDVAAIYGDAEVLSQVDMCLQPKKPSSTPSIHSPVSFNPFDIPFATPSNPFVNHSNSFATPSWGDEGVSSDAPPSPCIVEGDLLFRDERGRVRPLSEFSSAKKVAASLQGQLAWDREACNWMRWRGTHWEPLATTAFAETTIAQRIDIGTTPVGCSSRYAEGVTKAICKLDRLPAPAETGRLIPFTNGLLDPVTLTLSTATPDHATRWVLPYGYDPKADCPEIKAWLLKAVGGDQETVELLRAWMAALVRGLDLQYVLMLLGPGGSGKGVFQRLLTALIGEMNVVVTTLERLEKNRFETALLYEKRLAMVSEVGRYGGDINVLKMASGGDRLPLERKHVQQHGSFAFKGLFLLVGNDDLTSTDTTSGIERRRVTVEFNHLTTQAERDDWARRGGEEAVLHAEIPGLVNWLLELDEEAIRRRLSDLPPRVVVSNLQGMAAGNSVAAWLLECCTPDPQTWVQVGIRDERRDADGHVHYVGEADQLYPSYLSHCRASGRDKPVSLVRFRKTLTDIATRLGAKVSYEKHAKTRQAGLRGLRINRPGENAYPWISSKGAVEVPPLEDRGERQEESRQDKPVYEDKRPEPFRDESIYQEPSPERPPEARATEPRRDTRLAGNDIPVNALLRHRVKKLWGQTRCMPDADGMVEVILGDSSHVRWNISDCEVRS